MWPEFGLACRKQLRKKEKQGEAIVKPQLGDARRLRDIYFTDPEDDEQKETIKNTRKKLEIPMEAAMPCETGSKKRSKKSRETDDETKASNNIQKTKHACTVEAHESSRKRLEFQKIMKITSRKTVNFNKSLQFGAQVYSDA